MKKFLLTMAAFGLTAGLALAQTYPPPAPNPTANPEDPAMQPSSAAARATSELERTGKVISATPSSVVIETAAGERLTLSTDSTTNRASALAVGDSVVVRYHDMNGTLHAASITRSTPTAANPPAYGSTASTPAPTSTSSDSARAQDTLQSDVASERSLPDTASPLPLLALSGSLAAFLGLAARRLRRQV